MTGLMEGDKNAQLHAFTDALDLFGHPVAKQPKNRYEAFLGAALTPKPNSKPKWTSSSSVPTE